MHILIADDDLIHRRMLESILVRQGHRVTLARDGWEAWKALQDSDAPTLALLDWEMPGLTGPEVCQRLRQRDQGPYVYVILLTAMDQRECVMEGLQAGVDDY